VGDVKVDTEHKKKVKLKNCSLHFFHVDLKIVRKKNRKTIGEIKLVLQTKLVNK
jgi:hypothetical protein